MYNKLKKVIEVLIIATIICLAKPTSYASATILRQAISSEGVVTYYVSTHEENKLVFNLVKAHLDSTFRVVYSGEMTDTLDYLQEALRYNDTPQNQILYVTNGVSSYYSYSMSQNKNTNGTITVNYNVQYLEDKEQMKYVQNKIRVAIKENISNLKTDYEKAFWAYKWVADNVHYDDTLIHYSAYDGLQSSGTVCSGYAALYCNIANELGLDCSFVSGTVGLNEKVNHAWNIVKINGEWYCIDPTGGDNNFDKYFLKSKDTFSTADYKYHNSRLYDCYEMMGEYFSAFDYDNTTLSETHPIMLSVYNIEMDILRYNTLNIGEGYTFVINNTDHVPIIFASENPNIAIVDKNGIITGISEGVTTISAFNKDLNIEQKCKITVVSNNNIPTLSVKNINLKQKSKTVIKVKHILSGSKIRFVSSNPTVAKVNADTGKVTAMKKGKCKITCTTTSGTSIYVLETDITVE